MWWKRKKSNRQRLRRRSRSVKYEGRRFEVKATRHLAGADCAMQRDQCTHVFAISWSANEDEKQGAMNRFINKTLPGTNEQFQEAPSCASDFFVVVVVSGLCRSVSYTGCRYNRFFVVRHAAISHERRWYTKTPFNGHIAITDYEMLVN